MTKKEIIKNDSTLLQDSVAYLENRGFENIKANVEGYESPKSYTKVGSDVSITPNIVAERAGTKHYFEISLKNDEPTLLKSKWQFLDTITKMRDHRFSIITRKGHFKFTKDMLDDLHLDKQPIHL